MHDSAVNEVKKHIRLSDDFTGIRFGRLIAVGYEGYKNRKHYWLCQCKCGNKKIISAENLIYGHTKSCGCYSREIAIKRNFRHGMAKTRLWQIWMGIRERCRDTKSSGYYKYGARGIDVCNEWYNDFNSFSEWAIKNGYRDDLTIDRIDNNGNYDPNNCRWVDNYVQANNTRTNIFYLYNGKRMTLAQICRIEGVKYRAVWQLLKRDGYSLEKAILHRKEMEKK